MSTKVERFEKRISDLEDRFAPRKPVLVWRDLDQSEAAALARYLAARPEDAGRPVRFVTWATGPTPQPPTRTMLQ
jgi:hypothetical protein